MSITVALLHKRTVAEVALILAQIQMRAQVVLHVREPVELPIADRAHELLLLASCSLVLYLEAVPQLFFLDGSRARLLGDFLRWLNLVDLILRLIAVGGFDRRTVVSGGRAEHPVRHWTLTAEVCDMVSRDAH